MLDVQRTQIYLPKKLRQEIDKYRHETDESLAEYLRKAAKERLERQKRKKADLKKLAGEFIGSSSKSDAEIQEWLDWIQEEKRLVDESIDKKWER